MELGTHGYVAIFILIQFQKPFCPFSLGVLKKTIYSLNIHKPKKRKKEEKRKRKEKDKGTNTKTKRKELEKYRKRVKERPITLWNRA